MTINDFSTVQVHVFRRFGQTTEFLVLRRSENEILYPGVIQVVTGTIEADETAWEAAVRELFEETALLPEQIWTIPYIASFFDPDMNIIISSPVFAIEVNENSDVVLSEEHSDFEWLDFESCKKRLVFPTHERGHEILTSHILNSDQNRIFILNKDWRKLIEKFKVKVRDNNG